jgi:parallel beta-helix repeat protein
MRDRIGGSMRLLKAVTAVAFLFVAATTNAATWYVSTSGNDSNSGTLSSPFRTINKAAGVAKPGDEVLVRGGVYYGLVSIASKGTSSSRIVFRSYPGEVAVLDGTGTADAKDLVTLYKAEFVDFSNFEVRNATKIGITLYAANNIRLTGNEVHRSMRNGIYAGHSAFGSSYDILIDNNRVHDNVLENQYQTLSGGGWANAIVVSRTDRAQITNNRVYNNYGEGIDVLMSNNVLVRGNTVSDSFSVGIYLDNARYTTVDRNLVYSTGDTRFYRGSYPAAGIQMANESYSTPNPLTEVTITNNVVVKTKWGFYYGNYESGGGLKNVRIANNTFYDAAVAIIDVNNDTHHNSIFENNIFYKGPSARVAGSGVTYRNNNWYATNAGSAAGSGDVYGDPSLVRPGGLAAADYKLTFASAALAKGSDASGYVKNDHFASSRVVPFDIGAHQLSTGTTSTSDTQAPTAPTSLTATTSSSSSIALKWNASTDNVGVTGYRIMRNGALVTTVTGTSWSNSGLAASTTYSYQIFAIDAAGNQSAGSNIASATTSSAGDTQAPTAPSNLKVTGVDSGSVSLTWTASTDNVGVTGYRIYRDGKHVSSVAGTLFTDTGLSSGKSYAYYVTAVDAAGNQSAASNQVSATTTKLTGPKRRAV